MGDTSVTVAASTGALFPVPSAGQIFPVTVEDVSGNLEIMYCTGRTGDVLTVVRAQENTSALAFASGSRVELRCTAGVLAALLQKNGGDVLQGTTIFSGVLSQGSSGSIQGGEFTGAVRGAPGQTSGQIVVTNAGSTATCNGSVILTAANIAANVPSGYDLVHSQMILWWNGSTGAIPSGWQLCNGTNGTPNLEDMFIVGAGNSYTLGATGGSASAVTGSTDPSSQISVAGTALSIAQLPAHSHEFFSGVAASGNSSGFCPDWGANGAFNENIPGGTYSGHQIIQNTGSGTTHTHALSGNLAHTHAISLPPYYALYAIMKL